MHLFAERGYRGTSMRAIAGRARCNIALAYHHFGSKQALYAELFQIYSNRFVALFVFPPQPGTPAETVAGVADRIIAFLVDNRPLVQILLREVIAPGPVYLRRCQPQMRLVLDAAERALSGAGRRGVAVPAAPREFLLLLFGMLTYYVATSSSLATLLGEDPLAEPALTRLRGEAQALLLARLGLPISAAER